MRYPVIAVVTSTLQIVVQARSVKEAGYFSDAIDFGKWSVVRSECVRADVAKDFFLRKVKVEQDIEPLLDIDGPTLTIVKVL